ncbi:MAG TPA: sigma-70 family RNA polymerase sigma factor [Gemmatimonadales bacterium]|nr:sigma-70 family RNA polymerase sigma factor [Gemmatimonadales bacterium]
MTPLMNDGDSQRQAGALPVGGPAVPGSAAGAEAELARRFWDRVRLFAARRLRDPAGAEDVAQEVLRRVVDAIRADRLRDPAALSGFVFQTAYHVVLQRQRGAGREIRALQRLHLFADGPALTPNALALLISEERRRTVRAALERLGDEDRRLLTWLYHEQIEPQEVARRLAVTPGTLRVRKHRALRRLAELIGESFGNES